MARSFTGAEGVKGAPGIKGTPGIQGKPPADARYGIVMRSTSGSVLRTTQVGRSLQDAARTLADEMPDWELLAVQLQAGDDYWGMDE